MSNKKRGVERAIARINSRILAVRDDDKIRAALDKGSALASLKKDDLKRLFRFHKLLGLPQLTSKERLIERLRQEIYER